MISGPEIFDVTIVGAGPTGLFAAYYAGLRQMKTKLVDSLDQLGGQLTALYPEKYIYDVAGFPKVLARDLVKNLVEQGLQHHPSVHLSETAQSLRRDEAMGCFVITTDKSEHYSRTVVITAGAGPLAPRKLPVESANQWEDRGVYYVVKQKAIFKQKRLLIIGGGDSALDWAMNLHGIASEITIIHRRNQFRAHEDSVNRVQNAGIPILTFWELRELITTDGKISGAVIFNNQTREEQMLPVDAIIAQLGFISSLGAIKTWPLNIQGHSILVDQQMQTNVQGVFAAGDVAGHVGKLKLIATGFSEAAVAVNFAKTYIDPKARAFPGHSSEMGPQTLTTVKSGVQPVTFRSESCLAP